MMCLIYIRNEEIIMKKTLALLLAMIMCLPLAACSSNEKEDNLIQTNENETNGDGETVNVLVGEWKSPTQSVSGLASIVFNNDGTGTWGDSDFSWKYDDELSVYMMALESGSTQSFVIDTTENIVRSICPDGNRYYYITDYDAGSQIEYQKVYQKILDKLNDFTKIEIGQPMDIPTLSMTMTFTDVHIREGVLYLDCALKNNKDKEEYHTRINGNLTGDIYSINREAIYGIDFYYGDTFYNAIYQAGYVFSPNETRNFTVEICTVEDDISFAVFSFHISFGIASTQYDASYFLDLSEYLKQK